MDTDSRALAPRSVKAVLARKEGQTEKETADQSFARANVAKRKACSSLRRLPEAKAKKKTVFQVRSWREQGSKEGKRSRRKTRDKSQSGGGRRVRTLLSVSYG